MRWPAVLINDMPVVLIAEDTVSRSTREAVYNELEKWIRAMKGSGLHTSTKTTVYRAFNCHANSDENSYIMETTEIMTVFRPHDRH